MTTLIDALQILTEKKRIFSRDPEALGWHNLFGGGGDLIRYGFGDVRD